MHRLRYKAIAVLLTGFNFDIISVYFARSIVDGGRRSLHMRKEVDTPSNLCRLCAITRGKKEDKAAADPGFRRCRLLTALFHDVVPANEAIDAVATAAAPPSAVYAVATAAAPPSAVSLLLLLHAVVTAAAPPPAASLLPLPLPLPLLLCCCHCCRVRCCHYTARRCC